MHFEKYIYDKKTNEVSREDTKNKNVNDFKKLMNNMVAK